MLNSMKKAIIIEDEENGRLVLENLLKKYCPTVQLVGTAGSIKEAIPLIIAHEPHVVFLDIELPESNGFTLFDHFSTTQFSTIFVTAYSEYALKALKLSAIDYLLKPIDPDELVNAVAKIDGKNAKEQHGKINTLVHNINSGLSKIALPTNEGLIFIEANTLLRCEAESNYTTVYFKDQTKLLVSKNLGFFDDLLVDFPFFRVSRNALINMNAVAKFNRGKKSYVIMDDGTELLLSENKRDEFMQIFKS
jgi:two-component system, LytTR family, response regulator